MPILLQSAEIVTLRGRDALAFAQAQFTSDVASLASGHWQWSAWLDAHGRARAFFLLARPESDLLLAWLPLGDASALHAALARYVFRAAVRIETLAGWALHRIDEAAAPAERTLVGDRDGWRIGLPGRQPRTALLAPAGSEPADGAALEDWRHDDALAGLPLLAPALDGEFVPQALDLERVDAIRFDKGCYPGQEVAARLHFRGGNKRQLRLLRLDGLPVAPGAALTEDGRPVGRVLYAARPRSGGAATALGVIEASVAQAALQLADGGFARPGDGRSFLSST
jgi:tRNA-modifying protein YgfZ